MSDDPVQGALDYLESKMNQSYSDFREKFDYDPEESYIRPYEEQYGEEIDTSPEYDVNSGYDPYWVENKIVDTFDYHAYPPGTTDYKVPTSWRVRDFLITLAEIAVLIFLFYMAAFYEF